MGDNGKKILIGIIIAILLIAISQFGGKTQYEKDYESSRGKTWDNMTDGEKKVTRDEIEWKIKESKKSGKWND